VASLLHTLAGQALTAVETFYGAQGVALPARRLVSAGQSPWDCELVNVWVQRDYPTAGGPELAQFVSVRPHAGNFFRAGVLGVQVVRCYPTVDDSGQPPDPAEETLAAELVHNDADLVWQALLAASNTDAFSQRNGVAYEGWTVLGPDGGLAGGVLTVHALLPPPGA
jgi:hypothetical protein